MDFFAMCFVPFCCRCHISGSKKGVGCNDHEKLKLNYRYLKDTTQRLQPTDGIHQTDSITYLTPSALACYVSFVTGNKRKLDEETQ